MRDGGTLAPWKVRGMICILEMDFGYIYNTAIPLAFLIVTQTLDFGVDYLLFGSPSREKKGKEKSL